MGRPDYDDSASGGNDAPSDDYVFLIGDSTGSLTASGNGNLHSVLGTLQEGYDGTP